MKNSSIFRFFGGFAVSAAFLASVACGGAVAPDVNPSDDDAGAPGDGGSVPHRTTDGGDSNVPGEGHVDKQMFVTSDAYDATFGGLIGATQICMNDAKAAGLTGDWNPFFCGGPGMDANGIIERGTRYSLVNGTLIFQEDDAFVHGAMNPIDIDTTNARPSWIPDDDHIALWTNCTFDGRYVAADTCTDFTDDTANGTPFGGVGVSTTWGGGMPFSCTQKAGFLCIER